MTTNFISSNESYPVYNNDRSDVPTFIDVRDGTVVMRWYKNGMLHRENGPAMITKNSDKTTLESWYINGQLHRNDAPAIIHTNDNGEVMAEIWYKNNSIHRENGSAIIKYSQGKIIKEYKFLNGELSTNENTSFI